MQVAGDEIMERSPKAIKRDFRALGQLVEGSGAQVVFSLIPSMAGKNTERAGKLTWLTGGSGTGAIGGILVSLIMGRFTRHRACWRQTESSCLKEEKVFLPMSW